MKCEGVRHKIYKKKELKMILLRMRPVSRVIQESEMKWVEKWKWIWMKSQMDEFDFTVHYNETHPSSDVTPCGWAVTVAAKLKLYTWSPTCVSHWHVSDAENTNTREATSIKTCDHTLVAPPAIMSRIAFPSETYICFIDVYENPQSIGKVCQIVSTRILSRFIFCLRRVATPLR